VASLNLSDTRRRHDFFQQGILTNLRYWQRWLPEHQSDVAAMDRERDPLLRAIGFALELGAPAWPAVYELILTLAPWMERRGYWDQWDTILKQAVAAAGQLAAPDKHTNLLGLTARFLYRQSRFPESVAAYRRVIRLARQIDDRFNEARACTNLGFYFVERGHWHRAEVLCCHALDIFAQLDHQHGLAHTESHLGSLYFFQGKWDQAQPHIERACALWQAMGDQHGLMYGLMNLGVLHSQREQPEQALVYLNQALEYATRTGEVTVTGKILMNLGVAYRLNGEPEKAEEYGRRAEEIHRHYSNQNELGRVWQNLGLACLDQQKWAEARRYLEQSLTTRRRLNHQYGEIQSLTALLEYELARGHRARTIARLGEVEQRLQQHHRPELGRKLHALLEKYHFVRSEDTG